MDGLGMVGLGRTAPPPSGETRPNRESAPSVAEASGMGKVGFPPRLADDLPADLAVREEQHGDDGEQGREKRGVGG